MAQANPRWGAPRIHGELLKLGIDISQATVAKYMGRRRKPPSQTWRTFLRNHIGQIVAADFFDDALSFVLQSLTHLSLNKDTPIHRPIAPPGDGRVVAIPQLGGLHHRYERRAA
jgi:hypothetical protein